jgi:ribosome-associated toxin RatA of RatAB toxin-antitoxin module
VSLETIHREHAIVGVAPRAVFDVATDYACYPRIFPEFTGTTVLGSGLVEFRAHVIVDVRYVLEIHQDAERLTTEWTFVEGDVLGDSEGGWGFSGDDRRTLVTFRAGIAIKAPLPLVVRNKISNALLGTSVPNMFKALEREALARRKYVAR